MVKALASVCYVDLGIVNGMVIKLCDLRIDLQRISQVHGVECYFTA
jgi:hypothetical protein